MIDETEVSQPRNGVNPALLCVFQDNMLQVRHVPATVYYGPDDVDEQDTAVAVQEFRAPASAIADRLDASGVTPVVARDALNRALAGKAYDDEFFIGLPEDLRAELERQHALLRSLDADAWMGRFRLAPPDPWSSQPPIGSRRWLLSLLDEVEDRLVLRVLLLALTDAAEVILDVTELEQGGWLEGEPSRLASNALAAMRAEGSAYAPIVVLTEGRNDAEFLTSALHILFPHLTDLVRFLDYEQKPEGGAGALVRLVRSFAAAGIANKIVALFDNDAAAVDALRVLNASGLPPNIRAMRYPDTVLAASYPTLGPPNADAPEGILARADVNGLAASIELYLGRDVLTLDTGELRPVHWRSYLAGPSRYQGEVIGKEEIHRAFRAKCAAALSDLTVVQKQDWEDLRAIMSTLFSSFQS